MRNFIPVNLINSGLIEKEKANEAKINILRFETEIIAMSYSPYMNAGSFKYSSNV